MDIPGARSDYRRGRLTPDQIDAEPSETLARWLRDAEEAGVQEPTAFCLCTRDEDGGADGRFVLLRGLDPRGLVFHSHRDGRKGAQLAAQNRATAVFWWAAMERQVRVSGPVVPIDDAESDTYWAGRPRGSRLASAASPQSRPIEGREEMERLVAELDAATAGDVLRPETWGGSRIVPERWEFWQGGPARLHDRIELTREGGAWRARTLAP